MFGNKTQYAAHRGCKKPYLSKPAVRERLRGAMEIDPADGKVKINFEKADAILARVTDTAMVRKPSAPGPSQVLADGKDAELDPESMDAARRENLRLKNEDLGLKLAEQKGLTLPRAGVVSAAAQAGQSIRENIYALIPGLAERFATMTDAREIRTAMDGALRVCLESVVNDFMRRVQPAGTGEGQPVAH
jgi:hypothetical protein